MDTEKLDQALSRYCRFFENLSDASLGEIDDLFDRDALFVDPFNRVRGPAAIRRIFEHLLRHWPSTRFQVLETCRDQQRAFLRWTFQPDPERDLVIEGASRLEFGSHARVVSHRDYWDSASELYAHLPLTGPPTRWLLRRSQANAHDQVDE